MKSRWEASVPGGMAASPVKPREGISLDAKSWPAISALLPDVLPVVKFASEMQMKCQICNSCKCVAHCSATSSSTSLAQILACQILYI